MNAPVNKMELRAQARGEVTSQATLVEQSRAIAQVQGALIVARQNARNTILASQRMREACQDIRLAERAFFSYPRGGETVTGASIHLATELARCWGNVDYGISETRRDEARGESEMVSHAWDLETNARVSNSFIVPHTRDTKRGSVVLDDARSIYENNANNAARRLRECIFRVLPRAFVDEAQEICRYVLENGGDEPMEERREKLINAFGGIGISKRRLERRVGRPADQFTAFDIGELRIAFKSIRVGEADPSELFPDDTAEQVKEELVKKADKPKPETAKNEEDNMHPKLHQVLDADGKAHSTVPRAGEWLTAYRAAMNAANGRQKDVIRNNLPKLRELAGKYPKELNRELIAAEAVVGSDEAPLAPK